jgi:polyferredoxin
MAPFTILLADRFLKGAGWVEILLLSLYAAFILFKMSTRKDTSRLRIGIWLAFSIVFFTQFLIGLAGLDKLLMTGRLHVPVPAMVIAGPIYRGARFFMPILFLSTIVLVGPAWCSHLCYIGAWDALAARAQKQSGNLAPLWTWVRIALLVLTPLTAILLRIAGVSGLTAGLVAIGFGVLGIGLMAVLSTRKGVMVHCTSICPLGLAGNLLGKISPFRVRINEACTECGLCISACRYNALDARRIERRKPGLNCTLCGDCLASCREGAITYAFPGLNPARARIVFLTVIVSLHAVFLGVARI